MDIILFWWICEICVRVFINYRRVPVMLAKVTLHALYEINMGVFLLCQRQMSRADELFVNIYIIIMTMISLNRHFLKKHYRVSHLQLLMKFSSLLKNIPTNRVILTHFQHFY